jgi:signal recognition particle subunit SRP54
MDGDARGGAALSMRFITGKPIKFIGTGEKIDALEPFHPERAAGRILGMGDVVSLVEKAAETIDMAEAEAMAAKLAKGKFDMNDLRAQFQQMKKMGGLGALAKMLPGMAKAQEAMEKGKINDKSVARMEAIILSMTPRERAKPELLNARRKIRIANGSGVTVQEVNKLLKMHADMETAMKRLKKMGGLGALAGMFGGGMPGMPGAPGEVPGLPPGFTPPKFPGGLPGGFKFKR